MAILHDYHIGKKINKKYCIILKKRLLLRKIVQLKRDRVLAYSLQPYYYEKFSPIPGPEYLEASTSPVNYILFNCLATLQLAIKTIGDRHGRLSIN